MENIRDLNGLFEQSAQMFGERVAYVFNGNHITYQKVHEAVCRLAKGLKGLGIQKGDRIGLMLPNIPQFPIVYFAALRIGAIVVPINVLYKEGEIQYILEDSECRAIVAWDGIWDPVFRAVDRLEFCRHMIILGENPTGEAVNLTQLIAESPPSEEMESVDASVTAVILYTAGVTGHPKGAELSHGNLVSNALACADAGLLASTDIIVGVLPFYHCFGQTVVMNTALVKGATVILHPKFEAEEILRSIEQEKATIFPAVPTMFRQILDVEQPDRFDLSSLRYCLSGGARLPLDVMKSFESTFDVKIYEGYGLTEASPVVTFNPIRFDRKPGSVGVPLSGIEVKIVNDKGEELPPGEIGELVVRGPNVMKGYLNRPESTREVLRDGWLFTGDVARMDDEGYIYIVDRKRDLIIKGGFNVYPKEIEDVILHHPKVKEVAVVGVPDPVQGEEVMAFITLKDGQWMSPEEIIGYCREHIANYKCPKIVKFTRNLPKGPDGRILKRKLVRFRKS